MRVIPFEQRSDGWFAARLGVPTASSFDRVITPTGKPSSQIDALINELIAEKLTGQRKEIFVTAAMQRGTDLEPEARRFYEFATDNTVEEIGLCLHDTIDAGASPDGLVGDDGLLEIKCPSAPVHVEYLRAGILPPKYKAQVMGQLWVTDRKWCDFLSYHPEIKPFCIRVFRDDDFIKTLELILSEACDTISTYTEQLKGGDREVVYGSEV